MLKRKKLGNPTKDSKFSSVKELVVDGFVIQAGDMIKIKGQHGSRFIFQGLVTNNDTGVQWIDCIELEKNQPGPFRSFYPDDVKRIPKRRKGVNRDRSN